MDPIQVGVARRSITPTVPVSLAGYFNVRMWTDVLDDLAVQALALRQGDVFAVLVQFDLVNVPNQLMGDIRAGCRDIPGLAPQNLLFTATHTHTAPDVREGSGRANPEYNRFVVAQASAAVHEAAADLRPAGVCWGRAFDDRFAFNRRYWMKDGRVVTNPPRRDPGIDRPEGPIDPEIVLLGFTSGEALRVLLVNIVNHADTTTGTRVSGDWPGVLRRRLEERLPATLVIPLVGTEGNINHFDPRGPAEQSGPEVARRIGTGYAESVMSALPQLSRCRDPRLAAAAASFETGPREIDPAELARAREHAAAYQFDENHTLTSEDLATGSPAALKYFADQLLRVAADRSTRCFEVHAVQVGDGVLITLPGEPFVEIGLQVKKTLRGGRPTLIGGLSQDCVYIPNRCNFGRGGYETTPRCSPYSVETSERLLRAVAELLDGMGTRPA
jgi:neutral ceramidase